jgi:LysM repeat protein
MLPDILKRMMTGFVLSVLFFCPLALSQPRDQDEKNFSISLVKTAEQEDNIVEVDDKKVLTESYVVKEGDWIWKMFRERGLLEKRNLSELLAVLKRLNNSLENLDVVVPGQKIIIPLKISPVSGFRVGRKPVVKKVTQISELKDIDFENYTIEKGDTLTKVVSGRYNLPSKTLYGEYLELASKLNPSIKNFDKIYPGQTIRLPVYTAQMVRKPIDPLTKVEDKSESSVIDEEKVSSVNLDEGQKVETDDKDGEPSSLPNPLTKKLGGIFREIGEGWVETGKHFIPLKSGSQMDLDARSFPIINFRHGQRVILDLDNELPDKMAALIESSWHNYRIIHIAKGDSLSVALEKIFAVSNYPKIFKKGEPIELKGDIPFRITGDWIVAWKDPGTRGKTNVAVLNLLDPQTPKTPKIIKDYLLQTGIKIIDYPPGGNGSTPKMYTKPISGGKDTKSSIGKILELLGEKFSTNWEIPLFQGRKAGFKIVSKGDFLLKVKGKQAIIDLTGLAPEVVTVLEEKQYLYLSIAKETEPLERIAKVLIFLDKPFEPGPHFFKATERGPSENIGLTIPGLIFSDSNDKKVFASTLTLPEEIVSFLAMKGYDILQLPAS